MRYPTEHKERTRALLLKEAARAIRAQGPQRISVAAVMGKAGLTHGGFYVHFASKDELIAEAVTAMFAEIQAQLDQYIATKPPAQALAGYIDFYLSRKHRDDRARGCPVPALSGEAPHLPPPARRAFGNGIARLCETLASLLQALGQAQPPQAAAALLAQLSGALALARSVSASEQSEFLLASTRTALYQRFGLENAV